MALVHPLAGSKGRAERMQRRCLVFRKSGWCARLSRLAIQMRKRGVHVPKTLMRVSLCPRSSISNAIRRGGRTATNKRDRRHPEHKELRAWVGQHFDPELFLCFVE